MTEAPEVDFADEDEPAVPVIGLEVPEADALEQAIEVPTDDAEDYA